MLPIPLIMVLTSSAGFIAGALSRQPEINKLKKQLKSIQDSNGKLRIMMEKQQNQVEIMIIEYQKIKFFHIIEKKKRRSLLRGELCLNYMYKEYVDLLVQNVKSSGKCEMNDQQKTFFALCNKWISGDKINLDEEVLLRNYILEKYRSEILKIKTCDLRECINQNCA